MRSQQLWIVWGVMLGTLVLYAAMPLLLPAPTGTPSEPQPIFVGALAFFALFGGLATLVIRRVGLIRPARDGSLDVHSPAGGARFFSMSVITWALSEAVGIYGLILFLMFRRPSLLYPFLAAAALLLLVHAPRTSPLTPPAATRRLAQPDVKIG